MSTPWRRTGLGLVFALGLLSGCTTQVENFGYTPTEFELEEIAVGTDTQETVAQKVGIPPLEDLRRDDVWYYVSSRYETYAWRAPVEADRQIVAIRFSEGGSVSNIERFGLDSGEVIVLSRRTTDAAVPDLGFIRGLLNSTSLRPNLPQQDSL